MAEDTQEPQIISGGEAFGTKLAEVIAGAHAELALFSLHLTRRLYSRTDVLDALKQFVLRSERSHLRVLVANARAATAGGNPFLEFARRLPSRVQLREMTPEKRESEGPERLLADRRRLLDLPGQDRLEAVYHPQPAPRVTELVKEFDTLWDESEPVIELTGMQL